MRRNLKMRGLEETLQCDKCEYSSTSNALLKQHKIIEHETEKIEMRPRLSCDICEFKSTSETVLNQHKNLNHKTTTKNIKKHSTTSSKRKKCEYCDKQFNKEETYNKHVKKAHEN